MFKKSIFLWLFALALALALPAAEEHETARPKKWQVQLLAGGVLGEMKGFAALAGVQYQVRPRLAIELETDYYPNLTHEWVGSGEKSSWGLNLGILYRLQLADRLQLHGKAGASYTIRRYIIIAPPFDTQTQTFWRGFIGLGLEYRLAGSLGIIGSASYRPGMNSEDDGLPDWLVLGAGLFYRF